MATKEARPNPMTSKAMLAQVEIRQWGGRSFDRKITHAVNEERHMSQDAGRYNKLLLPKAAFQPIHHVVGLARFEHAQMTQPWMDQGTRILPSVLHDKFAARFRELRTEFNEAADVFAQDFSKNKKKAKEELNGGYNEEDYPAPSEVRGRFGFHVRILPFPDKADFRVDLAKEQVEDLRNELEAEMKIVVEDAMKEPVRRIIVVVSKMVERLKAYKPANESKGGKAEGQFRASLVENIRTLTDLLPAFNLTGDKALDDLTQRMVKELCAEDVTKLREDARVRKSVAKSAEAILKQAEALMA